MEDAALLRLPAGAPLVFTVDFITPIVDEPEVYGAIAAANARSVRKESEPIFVV